MRVSRFSGCSMLPTLIEGDVLFLEDTPLAQLKIGDIILFQGQDKTVCHRFFGLKRRGKALYFFERGDNCLYLSLQGAGRYLARVAEVRRGKNIVDTTYPGSFRLNAVQIAGRLLIFMRRLEAKTLGRNILRFGLGRRLKNFRHQLFASK